MWQPLRRISLVILLLAVGTGRAATAADAPAAAPAEPAPAPGRAAPPAPAHVEVRPAARDEEIARRLESILRATGWFQDPGVQVKQGVVFLSGQTDSDQNKQWAGNLARNTQDVAAVVNRIEVREPPAWDFGPALAGLEQLHRDAIQSLPFVAFGLVTLLVAWGLAVLVARGTRLLLRRRVRVALLREVIARTIGVLIFLLGLYIVLRVSGLTRLALTVLGGTGLLGLVIGIAFRDITENFLASVLLSVQQPFRVGDLVDLAGILGYVQQLNVRTTVLMTISGNQVQIPNATVYKSTIRNFTSNPNRREDFTVPLGYHASVPEAQETALRVLAEHPAVLKNPEPWVLVDALGDNSVILRVYFWLDGSRHSWLKVKSSVIRLVKHALDARGVTMPNDPLDVDFPKGIPLAALGRRRGEGDGRPRRAPSRPRNLPRPRRKAACTARPTRSRSRPANRGPPNTARTCSRPPGPLPPGRPAGKRRRADAALPTEYVQPWPGRADAGIGAMESAAWEGDGWKLSRKRSSTSWKPTSRR